MNYKNESGKRKEGKGGEDRNKDARFEYTLLGLPYESRTLMISSIIPTSDHPSSSSKLNVGLNHISSISGVKSERPFALRSPGRTRGRCGLSREEVSLMRSFSDENCPAAGFMGSRKSWSYVTIAISNENVKR